MKVKRLLSGLLALVMVLTATILPASAATTFPDIQSHWAKSYIEAMTAAGMFKGYEDGNFKPANQLTTAEALPSIIRWYKEEGYAFCTVSQLYDALE